jgi:UDP-N-acetylglucosamine--N-acetylmuramyl-(pentapeptide) pyrophosphoryl-undecaprenol N-acetylglucosamine transferase
MFPVKLVGQRAQGIKIIKDFKPDAAVGVGGYASGPLLYAASLKKIPYLIQEQNSYAGITNKWLGKGAKKYVWLLIIWSSFFLPIKSLKPVTLSVKIR